MSGFRRELRLRDLDAPALLQGVLDVRRQRLGLQRVAARDTLDKARLDVDLELVPILERGVDGEGRKFGPRAGRTARGIEACPAIPIAIS
jgi:hypothetical protein